MYLPLTPPEPLPEEELGPDFPEYAWSDGVQLASVTLVRTGEAARPLMCDAGGLSLRRGDTVVLELERSPLLAIVTSPPRRQLLEDRFLPRIQRVATEADLKAEGRARLREAEAVRVASEVVHALDVPAKVVRAELPFSGGRTVIYLASEDRVELREVGRQLASALRGRVELRHVGVRDAAKALGGVGPCGLQLCCNTFLADFAPVSIRQAKDQGLALNPQRVSGVCGRLMCCLVYEDAFYRQQRAMFPRQGKRVATPNGEGRVRDLDVLARTVRVAFPDGSVETFPVEKVQALTGPLAQGLAPAEASDAQDADEAHAAEGPHDADDPPTTA